MFLAIVGINFDGREVTATIITAANGYMKITYRCYADRVDVRARDPPLLDTHCQCPRVGMDGNSFG